MHADMREPTTRDQGRRRGPAERGIVIHIGVAQNRRDRGHATGLDYQPGGIGNRNRHLRGGAA